MKQQLYMWNKLYYLRINELKIRKAGKHQFIFPFIELHCLSIAMQQIILKLGGIKQ
jgi:hypothetical protein